MLTKETFADKVFFSNSGNEANEAAIKLARKYFYDQGKPEKHEIIVFTNDFHGRSMSNITAGEAEFQKTGFGRRLKGCQKGKVNNIGSEREIDSKKTAARVVKPMRGG